MSVIFATLSLLLSLNNAPITAPETPENGFSLEHLPEYVVVRSLDSGNSISIIIDHRKSKYHSQLEMLEDHLSNRKKLNVRNQSELLSAMSEIGYDYINAYSLTEEDMVNVVFRKKKEYRN